jgi:hypothetical protein
MDGGAQRIVGQGDESNDRIVTHVFKTINGKEVKAMEIVSVRKK